MKKADRDELIGAQLKCCSKKKLPFLMPRSGKCGKCGVDIVKMLKGLMETHPVKECPNPKCGVKF